MQDSRNNRAKNFKIYLPDLVSLFKVVEKPIVKYQEGDEGVKSVYSQTLESKEEILSILGIEGWNVLEFRQWGREYNKQWWRRSEAISPQRMRI